MTEKSNCGQSKADTYFYFIKGTFSMNKILLSTVIMILLLLSCNAHKNKSVERLHNGKLYVYCNMIDTTRLNKNYIPTGFYFLSDTDEGIMMRMEHSDEVYTILKNPFASVNNIQSTHLAKDKSTKDVTSLEIVFDSTGTKNLEKATSDLSHPHFAVVVANKLLYVVSIDQSNQISTGRMNIGLEGYTEDEMKEMLTAISHKK